MGIYVDADARPVVCIVERVVNKYLISVTLLHGHKINTFRTQLLHFNKVECRM